MTPKEAFEEAAQIVADKMPDNHWSRTVIAAIRARAAQEGSDTPPAAPTEPVPPGAFFISGGGGGGSHDNAGGGSGGSGRSGARIEPANWNAPTDGLIHEPNTTIIEPAALAGMPGNALTHVSGGIKFVYRSDYDDLRTYAAQQRDRADALQRELVEARNAALKEGIRADEFQRQLDTLKQAYGAACIHLQTLGVKEVSLAPRRRKSDRLSEGQ